MTRTKGWAVAGAVVRIVVVVALGVVICLPALFLAAWFVFAGARYGWVPSLVGFAGLGAAMGWLAVSRHWPVARRRATLGLGITGALLGAVVAHSAPPTEGRLRHEVTELALPGWELRDDAVDGNMLCFDVCLSVSREYAVDAPPSQVVAQLRGPLRALGFEHSPFRSDAGRTVYVDDRGEIDLDVDIAPRPRGTTRVYITADS